MDLQEVRCKINEIDEALNDLFDARLDCSAKVAEVKLETGDEVYKPARENAIYSRYSEDTLGKSHRSFVKKIVQISRKFQYSRFIDCGYVDEGFYEWTDKSVFERGGLLKLELKSDETGDGGLDIKSILEIAADTGLRLTGVTADAGTNRVVITFDVEADEESRAEALVLSYMLYKETLR